MSCPSDQDSSASPVASLAMMRPAPHGVIRDFLGRETLTRLLDYCLANEAAFGNAAVGDGQKALVDDKLRVSRSLAELGEFKTTIARNLADRLPQIMRQLGIAPFAATGCEMEMVAHGDGAFFGRHIDTFTGEEQPRPQQRMVTAVYYFHREPKGFTGGALRLFALLDAGEKAPFVDVEPVNDTLVFFPSWAPHEVRQIACPSRLFADSRFAVNCWICRNAPPAPR